LEEFKEQQISIPFTHFFLENMIVLKVFLIPPLCVLKVQTCVKVLKDSPSLSTRICLVVEKHFHLTFEELNTAPRKPELTLPLQLDSVFKLHKAHLLK
jgi:hypothetical protein